MKVYLIQNKEGIGYYTNDLTELEDLFSGADEPETYTVTNAEMTDDEFEELPEFNGF